MNSTSGKSNLPMLGGFSAKESAEELEERLEMRKQNPDLVPSMFLWKDFGERTCFAFRSYVRYFVWQALRLRFVLTGDRPTTNVVSNPGDLCFLNRS